MHAANGGKELARWSSAERDGGWKRVREGVKGVRDVSRASRGSGKQELAESGRARGDHAPSPSRRGGIWQGGRWWAGLATWAAGKRKVGLPLFILFYFCFLF